MHATQFLCLDGLFEQLSEKHPCRAEQRNQYEQRSPAKRRDGREDKSDRDCSDTQSEYFVTKDARAFLGQQLSPDEEREVLQQAPDRKVRDDEQPDGS